MNRYSLAGVVIIMCLCFTISESDACYPTPDIDLNPYRQHKALRIFETEKVSFYADCDYGGPIVDWNWSWPSQAYDREQQDWDYLSIGKCRFGETGGYWIYVSGYNEWGQYDTDNCIVYVFEMDLDISGVSDEDEEDPGGYICVNDDDDNDNGYPDKDDTGTVNGEDDLVAISLSYLPSNLYPGFVELQIPYYDDDIKVWSSSEKGTLVIPDGSNYYKRWDLGSQPSTLYVEGCSAGTADLWLFYTPDGQIYPDSTKNYDPVKFNVCDVLVDKLQYYCYVSAQWIDIADTLYVPNNDFVKFRAVPDPSDASWPTGKPVWGGSSGASGTGSTKLVTFSTLSANTSDYKTVTAECNNTVTANVIVYDFDGTLDPNDNFTGRNYNRYGIEEIVDLGCTITPSGLTAGQVGGLRWDLLSGVGTLSNITNNGTADYDADELAGGVTLVLEVVSGPCEGAVKIYSKTVVAPSGANMIQAPLTSIWHIQGCGSVGFKGWVYLLPKDVSFTNLEFSEGACPSIKTGFYVGKAPDNHPQGEWIWVGGGNISTGCVVLGEDTAAQLYYGPFSSGTLTWNIPFKYRVGSTGNGIQFTTATQYLTMSSTGTATVEKHGVGPFSKALNDPNSSY